jgi:hypothetical protein
VDAVVDQSSYPGIGKITDHRNVRDEKEQNEKAPTAMIPMISHDTQEEDAGAFKM